MRVDDDAAGCGLAEHFRQPHHRHRARADDVGEDLAGADRWELVDVTDEQQRGARRQGADERLHQQHVHHRRLVDHEQVAGERIRLVALEAAVLRVGLQQAVDGLRLDARGLGQALRRPTRRGAEGDVDALRHQHLQDGVHQRGLADARAAGDHQGLVRHSQAQGLALARRQGEAAAAFQPGNSLVDIEGGPGRFAAHQGLQALRDVALGPVQAGEEDAAALPERVSHHGILGEFERQRGREAVGRHLEQFGTGAQQVVLRQAAVAVVHGLGQGVADAGAHPHHGIPGDAELGRDLVGRLEADAAYVAREPVRIFADHRHGLGAVGLVDPHRPRRADAVGMQEQHDLAHHLLLGPAGGDMSGPHRADAFHLAQAGRVDLDDVEHRLAEGLHQPLRVGRTDAADHARAEVALDALDRRRRRCLEEVGSELQAVRAVVGPGTGSLNPFAGRDHRSVTDDGDEVALPARLQAQHAEAVFLVMERHALDQPGEVLRRRPGRRCLCRRGAHGPRRLRSRMARGHESDVRFETGHARV